MSGQPAQAPCFAGAAVDHGPFRSVLDLIEEQAARRPLRPAVTHDGRTLSYRELTGAAARLAAELAGRGVGRGDVVPVLLVNSLELPVCYLALMRLGAVFVPLDPAWPPERIRVALGVLSGGLVLTADPDTVPAELRALAVLVDVDRIAPAEPPPPVPVRPEDPIYGFFTSGTTGTPKCAVNLHGGLTNRFHFMTRYFAGTGDEVVLQNSRHTFDSSLWQLLWPLTTGGRTVLPVQGEFLNLPQTIDTIAAHGVTAGDFVSSVFNALVALVDGDAEALRRISSLRWLVVGSEPLNPRAVHRLRALLPHLRVANGYGPTEASIGMVFHTVSAADGAAIPLGRPIDNSYAVVVGEDLTPLPAGATGEIVIGGACLGAGYLGDPEGTARAFVPNPFPAIPGERLYRTGDLGHFDGQGRLLFAGRKDFQVKIGGVRVELGEIAVAAELCPGVRQAEVLVADQGGRRSLALFAAGHDAAEAAIRDRLRRTLPRAILPRYYLLLPEMPLGDNGKVDRARLQALLDQRLAADAAGLDEGAAGPATVGDQVLGLFRRVLADPGLAPDTGFFDAGGDSIQALTLVRALRAECEVRVEVQDLFDHPAAASMAGLVESRRGGGRAAVESEAALMERDAALPPGLRIRAADPAGELRTVLVTGATGFVGSRVVHALLSGTGLRVRCLARAAGDEAATGRVVAALRERGLWEPAFAARLDGHAADLAMPRLGLTGPDWDRLARDVDLVVHAAAMVNFLFDYRAHRAVNVAGTAELLRLALEHRPVPLHHLSTTAAFLGTAVPGSEPFPEDFDPALAAPPHGGYNRSKWIAERLLAAARERGALVTVLRLGEVMPAADNAAANPLALTHLLLSAFERLGVRPAAPIMSDYTPVDYAAERVLAAVLDRETWGSTLHVLHPASVDFGEAYAAAGRPLDRVSCGEFLTRLRHAARTRGDRELTTLAALLPEPGAAGEAGLRALVAELLTDNAALFRRDRCRALEDRGGLAEPPPHGSMAAYRARLAAQIHGVPAAPVPPEPAIQTRQEAV